jgi:hypothetical protein
MKERDMRGGSLAVLTVQEEQCFEGECIRAREEGKGNAGE